MVFFWFIIPFLVLMVLVGTRHQREEEDSGHSHDDPQYEDGEGFEEDEEEMKREMKVTKLHQHPCGAPHGSGTSGSRRTIANFLDIKGRDEVDAKVVRFLCACGIPFNVLHSPYWHDLVKGINEAPKGYKSPSYEKARTVLLDREREKFKDL
jgi:hypothetical protein